MAQPSNGTATREKRKPVTPDEFDPEDIASLDAAFARIEHEHDEHINGYRMEFVFDDDTANAIVDEWEQAVKGDKASIINCWSRYSYIVSQIADAIAYYNGY